VWIGTGFATPSQNWLQRQVVFLRHSSMPQKNDLPWQPILEGQKIGQVDVQIISLTKIVKERNSSRT